MNKFCRICNQDKPEEQFKINPRYNHRHWKCIDCQDKTKEERRLLGIERVNNWNKENPEKYKEYNKQRYKENKDIIREKQRKGYNKEKRHQYYLERTKDIVKKRAGIYGPLNNKICPHCNINKHLLEFNRQHKMFSSFGFDCICKDCAKIKRKDYYEKNKDIIIKRMISNIQIRIKININRRIHGALKRYNLNKSNKTIIYLGCDIKFFINYIESKFIDNMSWENYGKGKGKWNIDHKIPCRAFDLTKEEEQYKCFNYTNLQPLWEQDNFSKCDKLPDGNRARYMINF